MSSNIQCDVAIVGGGLSGALIALALAEKRPELDVRVVEGGPNFGGNHLWSFFATDIADADRWLVAPLVSHGWTSYDVAFPDHRRTLKAAYYSIESERLDRVIRQRLPARALLTGRQVLGLSARAVMLTDGGRIEAKGVIDCRGPADLSLLDLGWQKFVGQELALAEPHDFERPVVMDATVDQIDGYRFVYALPFSPTRLFLEDTYYSDTPDLDTTPIARRRGNSDAVMPRIAAYAAQAGCSVERVVRTEVGSLPIAMGGDFEGYWRSGGARVAKAGMRAGLFQPVTGYSLPDAVRTASLIARTTDYSGAALHDLTHGFARDAWRERRFYRMLSTMLFRAADPIERYRVLERFYRLDAGLIARFYAGRSSLFDRARVLAGKPPVPIGRAVRALWETRG